MREKLQQEITGTFAQLHRVLDAFKDSQFDTVPYSDSWTAGQVAEHIIKSASGFPQLAESGKEKADRAMDEKTAGLKKLFLDMDHKMKSPESIKPTATTHDKQETLDTLEKIRKEMEAAVMSHDLSLICEGADMPGFGKLTIYEWADFTMTHMQRHTRQLEKILNALDNK